MVPFWIAGQRGLLRVDRGAQDRLRMSFFSLLAALLLEQLRPLAYRPLVLEPLAHLAAFLESRCNAGERRNGIIAWLIGVGGLLLVSAGVHAALVEVSPLLAWLWNVAVLYMALGYRQCGRHYIEIQRALGRGEVLQARHLLAEWRGHGADGLSSSEIARLAIEEGLCTSHRHLFGVIACFLVLPGPTGAVLYRVSAFLAAAWGKCNDAENDDFASFARRSFAIIDWLPMRLTAASFAIVGNFEDAVYCWRTQSHRWPADGLGIVVASGAGALGVRLGISLLEPGEPVGRAEISTGEEADVGFMESAISLVWRALVLWVLLLLLVGLASLVGG